MRAPQVLWRNHRDEAELDFQRRLTLRQVEPVRDPKDVRVHGKRAFTKGNVEDDVGRLAAHTGQRLEPPPDSDPPDTAIAKGPKKKTKKRKAKFEFTADEPATFTVSVEPGFASKKSMHSGRVDGCR